MGGSSAEYLSCKVFRDWSIINLLEINCFYYRGISLLYSLKKNISLLFLIKFTGFGLEERTLHSGTSFN